MAVIAAASLVSCGGSGDKKDGGDKKDTTATKTTENKAPTGAKYAMKSGIIDLKSTMMGMEQKVTMYFDDFGKKEASVLTMEMMGMKTESRTIKKDGYSYDINMTKKECTKKKLPGTGDPNDLNFKDMSADMMKKMSIKKEGNERFLGKDCEKYVMDYKEMKMKGTYLVWNAIPLKTDVDMGGIKMVMEATKIQENASVPADKFEVPEGIKIVEK
jgi:hypothetical protein